jgi:branched-chain amino acid transport system substrate-binding protein
VKKMKRTLLALACALGLSLGAWASEGTTAFAADAPEKIRIGYSVSLSGPYAPGAGTTTIGNYKLWLADVNGGGGIMLKKYGKKVPVEFTEYDDQSQLEEAVKNTERLMLSDKVDFVLPPWGTATHLAVAPLYEKNKYPLLAYTAITNESEKLAKKWKHTFWLIDTPNMVIGGMVDMLKKLKDAGTINNKVAITFVADQLGVEMATAAAEALPGAGFEVAYNKSYPLGSADLSPVVKELKALGVDTYLSMSYPPDGMMLVDQSIVLGFSPKIFYSVVGPPHPYFMGRFGANMEGIMGFGGADPTTPSVAAYYKHYQEVVGQGADLNGGPVVYASLQMLQQAIEEVGEIDREKVTEVLRTKTFDTVLGPLKIEGQRFRGYWNVGQIQNGQWVGLQPADRAGAKQPMVPKPAWTPAK